MSSADASPVPPRRIGPDRVMQKGDRLVIESPVEMDHWEARAHRPILVRFEGRRWRIVRATSGSSRTFRYELEPWPPESSELPGYEFDYGPEAVADRDRRHAQRLRRDAVGLLLALLLPVVGWLGSGTKRRIEQRYAIDPVAATRASLFVEWIGLIVCGALLSIGTMAGAPWPLLPLIGLTPVLGLDLLFRYDSLIREVRYPPGFFQWIWPRKRGPGNGPS